MIELWSDGLHRICYDGHQYVFLWSNGDGPATYSEDQMVEWVVLSRGQMRIGRLTTWIWHNAVSAVEVHLGAERVAIAVLEAL